MGKVNFVVLIRNIGGCADGCLVVEGSRDVGGKIEADDIHTGIDFCCRCVKLFVGLGIGSLCIKIDYDLTVRARLNEQLKLGLIPEIGGTRVKCIGDLDLARACLEVGINVDCIELDILCLEALNGGNNAAVGCRIAAVRNKDDALKLTLAEVGRGGVKCACDIGAALINYGFLYAFDLTAR